MCVFVCKSVCVSYVYLCLCMYRSRTSMSDVPHYYYPSYSLEAGYFIKPRSRLAVCKPQMILFSPCLPTPHFATLNSTRIKSVCGFFFFRWEVKVWILVRMPVYRVFLPYVLPS